MGVKDVGVKDLQVSRLYQGYESDSGLRNVDPVNCGERCVLEESSGLDFEFIEPIQQ